uniref:ShKT domain-containing protein n=1 Tax=Panagrellus redivivus TaxID=6233 RepID=A0A7E4VTI5_PANRE
MYRFAVTVMFWVLLIAIAQVAADLDCKVPFKPFKNTADLCYARLSDYDCKLFNGTFLNDHCLVRAGQSFDYNGILLLQKETTFLPRPATTDSPIFVTTDSYPQCKDHAVHCKENKNLCTNPVYQSLMIKHCARICGYCHCNYNPSQCGVTTTKKLTPPLLPQCRDASSDCPSKKGYCKSFIYGKLMAEKCRFTCGYCRCTNAMSNCSQLVQAGQCDKHEHHGFMAQNCRQACGWC